MKPWTEAISNNKYMKSHCKLQKNQVILLPDIHYSIKVNGIPHTLSLQWCLLTNYASNMAPNVIARIHNRLSQNPKITHE